MIPEKLETIPQEYIAPADHAGVLQKLDYQTDGRTKTAWVYVPYGYDPARKYNTFYLSHGGWSDETTIMGTASDPATFKNVIDHAMEDGRISPMILVMVTYNKYSDHDSWDYNLAIQLTDQFHHELTHDLIPAVESKYSTYGSRDHRGFGGFSMGSVNTWCTFRYALDHFRYFMPMSGNYSRNGHWIANMVREQGYGPKDFFIFAMSGPDDFAYPTFKAQIQSMARTQMFRVRSSEAEGNLAYREMPGYPHGREASELYTYNGLQFFWKEDA